MDSILTNSRFIKSEGMGIPLTSYSHPSLDSTISGISRHINFYRGPLPASNTRPDNVYAYYMTTKYKSQRITQPNLLGSL